MKLLFGLCGLIFATSLMFVSPVQTLAQIDKSPEKPGYFLLNFPCTGEEIAGAGGERVCNFKDFMTLLDRFITLMLYIAVVLAIISFVYAGFKLIISGGNEDALKHAKHIFWNVFIGLVLAYLAWTIVHFVLTTLGVPEGYTLLE